MTDHQKKSKGRAKRLGTTFGSGYCGHMLTTFLADITYCSSYLLPLKPDSVHITACTVVTEEQHKEVIVNSMNKSVIIFSPAACFLTAFPSSFFISPWERTIIHSFAKMFFLVHRVVILGTFCTPVCAQLKKKSAGCRAFFLPADSFICLNFYLQVLLAATKP